MSRNLSDLNPQVQQLAEQFLTKCKEQKLAVKIICTFRTFQEQDALYRIGRDLPGDIVTNARGGESFHNYRIAFDAAPVDDKGNIDWNDKELFTKMGEIGETIGLEWGGRFTFIYDPGHFQYTFGLTIAELQDGAKIPDYPST